MDNKANELTDWLYDAGVGEKQTVVMKVNPEMIPNLHAGQSFTVTDATKTVTAIIGRDSKIEWSDEEYAWIATLVIEVQNVTVSRNLRLESP